jgi:hypothetical protein
MRGIVAGDLSQHRSATFAIIRSNYFSSALIQLL